MVNHTLIVHFLLDVKAVPDIATDDNTAKTEVLHLLDRVKVHASQGVDVAIDKSTARRLLQLLLGERGLAVGL